MVCLCGPVCPGSPMPPRTAPEAWKSLAGAGVHLAQPFGIRNTPAMGVSLPVIARKQGSPLGPERPDHRKIFAAVRFRGGQAGALEHFPDKAGFQSNVVLHGIL